jgi:hypothetical protein
MDMSLALWDRVVREGFTPVELLAEDPTLEPLRARPEFLATLETARQRRRIAHAVFERGGGPALLGVTAVLA